MIDIYDPVTDIWTTANLSAPRVGLLAGNTENYLLFAGGGSEADLVTWMYTSASDVVDIYNKNDDSWKVFNMMNGRINHSVMSVDDQVFIAGGGDFPPFLALGSVDVFTDGPTSVHNFSPLNKELSFYPNPVIDQVILDNNNKDSKISVLNAIGEVMISQNLIIGVQSIDLSILTSGIYFLMEHSHSNELLAKGKLVKL